MQLARLERRLKVNEHEIQCYREAGELFGLVSDAIDVGRVTMQAVTTGDGVLLNWHFESDGKSFGLSWHVSFTKLWLLNVPIETSAAHIVQEWKQSAIRTIEHYRKTEGD